MFRDPERKRPLRLLTAPLPHEHSNQSSGYRTPSPEDIAFGVGLLLERERLAGLQQHDPHGRPGLDFAREPADVAV
jgi:hypothetical protein